MKYKIVEMNNNREDILLFFRFVFIALLVLLIVVWIIRAILLWLFPSLLQTLGGEIGLHLFSLGVLITPIFILLTLSKIANSIYGKVIIKWAVKIVLGILILILAYFIYPAGITDTPLAMLTLGSIGRFLIFIFLVMAFVGLMFADF